MNEKKNDFLSVVQKEIGYKFKNVDLLEQAFTRRTYSLENGGQDNEVLEFIGDQALDFAITRIIVEYFGEKDIPDDTKKQFTPLYDEGKLTEIKKKLVNKDTLAKRMTALGYYEYLKMGKGDIKRNIQNDYSVKEDLFEAIIGAVTLDSKWNLHALIKVIVKMLDPGEYLENQLIVEGENYVAKVQEWVQKKKGVLPDYSVKKDDSGFTIGLTLSGVKISFKAKGPSIRKAKMAAAYDAYRYLVDNDMMPSVRTYLKTITYEKSVNQLQEIAQKKFISMPHYEFESSPCLTGGTNWLCKCKIDSEKIIVEKLGASKPEARKNAAEEVLNLLKKKYD